jgi:hypothetical protein
MKGKRTSSSRQIFFTGKWFSIQRVIEVKSVSLFEKHWNIKNDWKCISTASSLPYVIS